jgi:glutamine kinase
MKNIAKKDFVFGTKAETLSRLSGNLNSCSIPHLFFFTVGEWRSSSNDLLERIGDEFHHKEIIIRSSAINEDSSESAMAGEFLSIANIEASNTIDVINAINDVIESYGSSEENRFQENQVLVQEMANDVSMSGVLFTKDMNSGAPYYVINYDDETGRTDTVSSGMGYCNRTLYIHRSYGMESLHSRRFLSLIEAVKEIEKFVSNDLLDIEFAISNDDNAVSLLQVRRITTHSTWKPNIDEKINNSLAKMKKELSKKLEPIENIAGNRGILGRMPDWNPAEIIGTAPRPLAYSLYHLLITNNAWSLARRKMGYAYPDNQALMTSLAGQPFIDVRLSFFSYLPDTLPLDIGEKLVNAWLDKLENEPNLHDKVEFKVATTAFTFDLYETFINDFPNLLTEEELTIFQESLRQLTKSHVEGLVASIDENLNNLKTLESNRDGLLNIEIDDHLNTIERLANFCIQDGTIPFSVLARHGFIAKALLDSMIKLKILSAEEVGVFQKTIPTVATDFIDDLDKFAEGVLTKEDIIKNYGHLRPGTYDILSIPYKYREDLLIKENHLNRERETPPSFELNEDQALKIDLLLEKFDFSIKSEELMRYIKQAIQGREYSKFIFTKSIDSILEIFEDWGKLHGFSKDDLSFMDLNKLLSSGISDNEEKASTRLNDLIERGRVNYEITERILLPSLISDVSDLFVIPLLVGEPNFITKKIIQEEVIKISGLDVDPEIIDNKIVLIENADPGFDWIFSRSVKGLITKYGGANSHMAIRCAEFGLPAAIGCGEQIFQKLEVSNKISLNCAERKIDVISIIENS